MITLGISQGIFAQGSLFFAGFVAGVVVWFMYDLLRLWRRILPRGVILVAVEDVAFFFLCTMAGFELLYPQNLGQVKGFLVLAFFVGSLIYRLLAGRFLMRAGSRVIHKAKSGIRRRLERRKKKIKENP